MISKIATIKKDSLTPQFVIEIAQKCSSFDSSITMYAKDQTVNLKSIVNIFGTSIENDEEVELVFSGNDEQKASEAILKLLER